MRAVFDLDNTLADCEHRAGFLEKQPRDWDSFYEACDGDIPIVGAIEVLYALHKQHHAIEIWTGRRNRVDSYSVMQKTLEWLDKYRIQVGMCVLGDGKIVSVSVDSSRDAVSVLRMRGESDHRADSDVKRDWLHALRDDGFDVDLVFEDRQRVVDMWRAEGVRCYQVAKGDF